MNINKVVNTTIDNYSHLRVSPPNEQSDKKRGDANLYAGAENLSRENINDIVDTLNSAAKSVHKRVSFSVHEKTNRVIMKVENADTNEVIREIPAREMIRLLEHIHDLLGTFIDESR